MHIRDVVLMRMEEAYPTKPKESTVSTDQAELIKSLQEQLALKDIEVRSSFVYNIYKELVEKRTRRKDQTVTKESRAKSRQKEEKVGTFLNTTFVFLAQTKGMTLGSRWMTLSGHLYDFR